MKKITLTQNQVAIVDDQDFEWLNEYKWYALWLPNINGYYAVRAVRDDSGKWKKLYMARFILDLSFGDPLQADHINRNSLDNRRKNLRIVTPKENLINQGMRKDNTSGAKGVYWHKCTSKWQAQIYIDGKKIHLGLFLDKADAIARYKEAEVYYGYSKIRNGGTTCNT